MKRQFADTSYYLALVNPQDMHHEKACEQSAALGGAMITTAWVLMELGNFLSVAENRRLFLDLLSDLRNDARVTIVPASVELFEEGIALFARRMDKNWSLTDCTSFVVMERHGLKQALTTDHHFAQAGFQVLLK